LTCLEIDEKVAAVAREGWRRAGVEDRVDLRIGDAKLHLSVSVSVDLRIGDAKSLLVDILADPAAAGSFDLYTDTLGTAAAGAFDLVFIDADKEGCTDTLRMDNPNVPERKTPLFHTPAAYGAWSHALQNRF
ncbi:hypothetical protein T484DRAFT_1790356, partial [Baffinella frigidus]